MGVRGIGSGSFTPEEWDEFLEKIDAIQDEMRQQMQEETESTERPAEPEHFTDPEQYERGLWWRSAKRTGFW